MNNNIIPGSQQPVISQQQLNPQVQQNYGQISQSNTMPMPQQSIPQQQFNPQFNQMQAIQQQQLNPQIQQDAVSMQQSNQSTQQKSSDLSSTQMIKTSGLDVLHGSMFEGMDFGPLKEYLENDDITDISYSNNGQVWLKTLSKGIYRVENPAVNNAFIEKLAFQCSNVMGKSFNAAHPFLDSESAELRMNFVHDSVARNGVACLIRKTPAKIRLERQKIIDDKYITEELLDFLITCVHGHCNTIVCGETGSGKTEFVKFLASNTIENEKLITIEDTLELHLDRIYPNRDIVAMKTNNIASYSDVLVTCMRQNPKWILLSEVRSAEAVMAVRNSISSGHYILSTIHADKASSIPNRMYSLLETNQDIEQFLKSIYRYIQLGIYIRGYQDKVSKRFVREIGEVVEFYVTEDNEAKYNTIYKKTPAGKIIRKNPSKYLQEYLEIQGVNIPDGFIKPEYDEVHNDDEFNIKTNIENEDKNASKNIQTDNIEDKSQNDLKVKQLNYPKDNLVVSSNTDVLFG